MSKLVTQEELEKVAYGDLLKKFKELGVESAWVPGSKKKDMIKNALDKLVIVKKMIDVGLDQEAIESQLELAEQKKAEDKLKEKVAKEKEKEDAEQAVVKEIFEKKMDLPTLHKVLKNIDANLNGGASTHREILLKKRNVIQTLIDEAEGED